MSSIRSKILALAETLGVFSLVALGFKALLTSPLGAWETRVLGQHLVEYAFVLVFPLLLIAVFWKDFERFGISFRNIRSQINAMVTGFLPMLMISSMLHFIGWQQWDQTLLISAVEVVVLFMLAWLLRKSAVGGQIMGMSILILSGTAFAVSIKPGQIFLGLFYSLVLVSLGEEVLFRGYIQSRLNECFGRPFRFFGVSWGWGLPISSLMFGLWHLLIPFNPFSGEFGFAWQWGLWTFFLGLILGYVRERTDSVLVSAILHGVINF